MNGDSSQLKMTAIYVRVSTSDQTSRSQLPDLNRYSKSIDGAVEWYRDTASGMTMARPEWTRLWDDTKAGKVARIVVWRLDRLGRTASGMATLFDELVRRKVTLVTLTEGIDLATPAGRLMAHVVASVGQYETEVRGERQRAGIAAAKAAGVAFGRPRGSGRPSKLTAEKVALIRRLKADGSGPTRIAHLVGISRDSVYEALRAGDGPGCPPDDPGAGIRSA